VAPFILFTTLKRNKVAGKTLLREINFSVKKLLLIPYIVSILLVTFINTGCKKGIKDPVTLDKAAGKWSINAIRMQVLNGSTIIKDSTIPWRPVVENFVTFNGISTLNYNFNQATTSSGNYTLYKYDSIRIQIGSDNRKWKILLLTTTNFNIETTSTDNNAYPGSKVVTFQGFVR